MVEAHPQFEEIKARIKRFSGVSFSAVCYRCTEPKFANEIVSGLGSQLYGGRWTPKGSFATVYLCETAEAALQEYLARGRRMKIPDHKALPMVMAAVTVKVGNLLDVTNAEVEKAVRFYLEGEKGHWRTVQGTREAVSQAIGRAAYELKFSGLMVMSQALKGGRNVVLFPKNLQKGEVLSAPEISIGAWK